MSFRTILIPVLLVGMLRLTFGQVPAKKYRWKNLGPFVTSKSNTDKGRWTAVGQGWIEDFIISDDGWYAGSITGGLYKSNSQGRKWKKVDTDTLQMGTLCLLKVDKTIYRGTGLTHYNDKFGVGLLKSDDGGKSWIETGLKFNKHEKRPLWDVTISKVDKTMAACTPNEVFVSHDNSETWENVYSGKKEEFKTVLFDYSIKNTLWAVGNKLLVSKNNGQDWEDYTPKLSIRLVDNIQSALPRIAICQDPNNASRYLVFYGFKNRGYVDESLDGGETWLRLSKNSNVSRADAHHTEISIAPDNSDYVLLGTYRAYLSSDGGKRFEVVSFPSYLKERFVHDDIREVDFKSTKEIYLATDGGVFVSKDTARSWQNVSGKGLTATQIYGLSVQTDQTILIGCQDMSYFTYKKRKWTHLGNYYGDGGDAIETSTGTHILLGGRMKLIDLDKGLGSKGSHPRRTRSNPFVAKFHYYPNSKDSFYYIGNDCWFFDSKKWINLTQSLDGKKELVSGFDINISNPKQLFMSFNSPTWSSKKLKGKFYKSDDGGTTWSDYTSKLPILAWHHITGITTNSQNPDEVYVSLGKMDSDQLNKVYKSLDGGHTWENYSTGIPPYETFGIKHIPGTSGTIVSSIQGLFYRNPEMSSWQKLGGKIPPIVIRDFELDLDERTIYAGTYGNGLWKMKIPRKMLKY
ncbi:MAG: hypothetical protein COA58_02705 [Bacteroidetes bacterium]|nr:MAG: hypothetical protein COA58_02705 [Bacteroidota bacterium]